MVQTERETAPQSAKAFCGLWATVNALVGGARLDLPEHESTHDPRHDTHTGIYIENTTNIHLQTCASWRHVNQPETLPTY